MDDLPEMFRFGSKSELHSCALALKKLITIEPPELKPGLLRAIEFLQRRIKTLDGAPLVPPPTRAKARK